MSWDIEGGLGLGIVKTKKEKFFCDHKKEIPTELNIPTKKSNSAILNNTLTTKTQNLEGNNVIGHSRAKLLIPGTSTNYSERLAGIRWRFESESGTGLGLTN